MKEITEVLKGKIGQEISLTIHTELRDEQLGNMGTGKPDIKNEVSQVIFLGLYGLNNKPGYLLVTLKGEPALFKGSSLEIFTTEETGNPNHNRKQAVTKIDGEEISSWNRISIYDDVKQRLICALQADSGISDVDHAIQELERGIPGFRPRSYNFDSVFINDPAFIDRVKKYFDQLI